MAEEPKPVTSWTDRAMTKLVELAQARIRLAGSGNAKEIEHVIAQATLGLREVVSGRLPDPERTEYLRYVLAALERINRGIDPVQAFGLRPKPPRSLASSVPTHAPVSHAAGTPGDTGKPK